MRLSVAQVAAIKQEAEHCFGANAEVWLFGSRVKNQRGFTLVELITVMVIVGILAVVALPRFFDRNVFESRGYYDQAISTLRYAQKTAVAQRTTVCVVDTATEIGLFAADCATPLNVLTSQRCPTDQINYQHKVCVPAGVSITSAHGSLSFTALGSTPVQKIYTVSGYATAITVEAGTGYVH
jgi:MSHA pilin protein MshC